MAQAASECPVCGGSGWKNVLAKPPVDAAGRKRPPQAVRCDCRQDARLAKLLANARIPARYEHCSLSDFHTDFHGSHRSLASARLSAGRFVEEYPVQNTGLLIIGPVGVGKTHLAVGIAKELIEQKGIGCMFCDYRELLKQIQNSYNPSVNTTELEVLRPVFDAEVLVLDELGAVKPTEWVWDTVSHVLNTRYNHKRTTIITTNYPNQPAAGSEGDNVVSQLGRAARAAREETLGDRIGERMRSRLHEMCRIVEMGGGDFRQRVQSANFR
jgi:DNA replication protein DnaC